MFLKQCGVTQHGDRQRINNYFSPFLITCVAKLLQLLRLSRRFIPGKQLEGSLQEIIGEEDGRTWLSDSMDRMCASHTS